MNKIIAICGGSGLIGRAMSAYLSSMGYQVRIITRTKRPGMSFAQFEWDPAREYLEPGALDGVYGVIQLAGESIEKKRWTASRKKVLYSSRIGSGRFLIKCINQQVRQPRVYLSMAGIGIFGDRPGEILDESAAPGPSSFISDLSRDWEGVVSGLDPEVRKVILRTSPVLSREEGILKKFYLPASLGIAPVFGNGKQFYSWIHIEDLVRIFCRMLTREETAPVYHATAPAPVSQKEMVTRITRLAGPFILKVPLPHWGLKLALGQLADTLYESLAVVPGRLLEEGFEFRYPDLDSALTNLLKR